MYRIGGEKIREKVVELMRRHNLRDDEDVILNRRQYGSVLRWILCREVINEADRVKPLPAGFLKDFEKELVAPVKQAWEARSGHKFYFEVDSSGMTDADLQQRHRSLQAYASMRMALDR